MKLCSGFLVCMLFALSLAAQGGSLVATASPEKDGSADLFVQNQTPRAVTAMILQVNFVPLGSGMPRGMLVKYQDSATNPFDRSLMPGDSQTFHFGGPQPGPDKMRTEAKLQAAVFDDGSTFGDPSWANRLIQQRQSLLQHLGIAINLLAAAKNAGMSREEILGSIQSESKLRLASAKSHEEPREALFERRHSRNFAVNGVPNSRSRLAIRAARYKIRSRLTIQNLKRRKNEGPLRGQ